RRRASAGTPAQLVPALKTPKRLLEQRQNPDHTISCSVLPAPVCPTPPSVPGIVDGPLDVPDDRRTLLLRRREMRLQDPAKPLAARRRVRMLPRPAGKVPGVVAAPAVLLERHGARPGA